MKYAKFLPAAALALSLIMPVAAHAAVITFDEFAADNYAQGGIPAGRYAYLGVTFSTTDDGSTWDGTANGDPGFWYLNGTNGPIFSGYNGNSYGARMLFTATDVSGVLLDAARPWVSSGDVTFTLQGWLDGALVDSEIVIMAPNIVNQWSTLSLTGVFDELRWFGSGQGFYPFAVDNIRWDAATTGVPEPGSLALAGLALGLIGAVLRRQR